MKYFLEIKEPCTENWDAMSPTEKGRFCNSCEKEVVDFTSMHPKNIVSILNESNGKVCGRITHNNLNIPIEHNVKRSHSDIRKLAAGFLLFNFLGLEPTSANSTFENKNISVDSASKSGIPNKIKTIKGKVISKSTGEKLKDVHITIENTNYSTYSDSVTGEYSLRLSEYSNDSITLKFTSLGFEIKTVTLHLNQIPETLDIELNESIVVLDDVIIISELPKRESMGVIVDIITKGKIEAFPEISYYSNNKFKRNIRRLYEILSRNKRTLY